MSEQAYSRVILSLHTSVERSFRLRYQGFTIFLSYPALNRLAIVTHARLARVTGAACNADRDCDGGQCQSGIW